MTVGIKEERDGETGEEEQMSVTVRMGGGTDISDSGDGRRNRRQ